MSVATPITATPQIPPDRNRLLKQQHLVMEGVSWSCYEDPLSQVGNRSLRITYDHGRMEIMAPLAEHEFAKGAIARLVETLALELDIPLSKLGSTTFRGEEIKAGLEPDECYYLKNAHRVRGMKRFDPAIYPPPDLAIEVDITSRSVPRQPIYANLDVPELWRFDGSTLSVLRLHLGGYRRAKKVPPSHFYRLANSAGSFVE